jgi:hypothetical protein
MSFLCSLGRHSRSLTSIIRKQWGDVSLCERCGLPMVKRDGRWVAADPAAPLTRAVAATDA